MLLGKRVVRRRASVWRVEFREVVMRVFGRGWGKEENRVGKRVVSAEGVRSRFVFGREAVGLVARSLADLWESF